MEAPSRSVPQTAAPRTIRTEVRTGRPAPAVGKMARGEWAVLAFLFLHMPLALVLSRFGALPAYHALATLGLGVWWATVGKRLDLALCAACYTAGAEVLWRMTGTGLFWEFGKYGVSLILLLVLARLPSRRGTAWMTVLYFALLVPSALLTLRQLSLAETRDALSFNLSGPFSLTVAVLCFSSIRASAIDLRLLVCSLLAPILGVLAICSSSTISAAGTIRFYAESNYVTSGGFGPNQVSAVLGLGALLALLIAFQSTQALLRWIFLGLTVAILTQGVLTFSRGGVLNALICASFLGVHLIQQPRVRASILAILLLLTFVGSTLIFPRLNEWTGGALEERYATTGTGLRQTIAEEEIELWKENPALGVGPGMAKLYRSDPLGIEVAAHTEFTRLLAEHGTFGLAALILLIFIAARAYFTAPSPLEKAWVSSFAGWAFIEMSHSAMRIAAISVMFGLAILQWRRRA